MAVRYAIRCVGKLDGLVVTCVDRLANETEWRICTAYEDGPDMEPGPFKDLAYQESLTRRLLAAKPVYETSRNAADHLAAIERETDLPIWITSHGVTCEEIF